MPRKLYTLPGTNANSKFLYYKISIAENFVQVFKVAY